MGLEGLNGSLAGDKRCSRKANKGNLQTYPTVSSGNPRQHMLWGLWLAIWQQRKLETNISPGHVI